MSVVAEIAIEMGIGAIMGMVQHDSLIQQQKQICEQVKQLKKSYQEYYNGAYDYINNGMQESKQMIKETENIKLQIKQTNNKLAYITKQTEYTQLVTDIGLVILLVVIAITLYIKYTGGINLDELDIPD